MVGIAHLVMFSVGQVVPPYAVFCANVAKPGKIYVLCTSNSVCAWKIITVYLNMAYSIIFV